MTAAGGCESPTVTSDAEGAAGSSSTVTNFRCGRRGWFFFDCHIITKERFDVADELESNPGF